MTEWLPKVSIDVALEVRYSKNAPSLAHLKWALIDRLLRVSIAERDDRSVGWNDEPNQKIFNDSRAPVWNLMDQL